MLYLLDRQRTLFSLLSLVPLRGELPVGNQGNILKDFCIETWARRVSAPPPRASSVALKIEREFMLYPALELTKNPLEVSVTTLLPHNNYHNWQLGR